MLEKNCFWLHSHLFYARYISFCLMQSVTIAIQEDIYIALSAEWSLSILRYIFFLFISKTTLKRRQNILNDELNIHITYIFDDFLWNSNLLYFILTIYGYIFIYWEWLINICFASILIGFTAVDWNRKTLHQVNTSSMY